MGTNFSFFLDRLLWIYSSESTIFFMNAAKFSLHLCFCVNIIDKSLLHLFLSEDAAILGGYGAAGLILDAPHRHAVVSVFDPTSDILGIQRLFDFICNY